MLLLTHIDSRKSAYNGSTQWGGTQYNILASMSNMKLMCLSIYYIFTQGVQS